MKCPRARATEKFGHTVNCSTKEVNNVQGSSIGRDMVTPPMIDEENVYNGMKAESKSPYGKGLKSTTLRL